MIAHLLMLKLRKMLILNDVCCVQVPRRSLTAIQNSYDAHRNSWYLCDKHISHSFTADEGKHIYLNNEKLNWWAARANCQEKYDDLFVPVTGHDPYPEDETYYWLGAMRYSTWRWTGE